MKRSLVDIIPTEIWEKIFSYATVSSLLPFTENGKIASSLIDTIDLFSGQCRDLRAYIDDTQAIVERLRLVCRTWARLLWRIVNEIAHTNLTTYYFPSLHLMGGATYLWTGDTNECFCWLYRSLRRENVKCVHESLGQRDTNSVPNDLTEDILLNIFSSHLKILFWSRTAAQRMDLPLEALGNLMALSMSPHSMPSSYSLKRISSFVPYLSHFHFSISEKNAHLLFEEVEFPSISYLSLKLEMQQRYEASIMVPWKFPRLRTFIIQGTLFIEHRADFEKFLYNHRDGIVEFDAHGTYYAENGTYNIFFSPSLWKICPNIKVIGMGPGLMAFIQGHPESDWETPELTFSPGLSESDWEAQNVSIPPLTLLVHNLVGLWENDLDNFAAMKKRLNIKKVVYVVSWDQRDQREASMLKAERFMQAGGPKLRAQKILDKIMEIEIVIVDKFGSPLSDFFTHLAEL
jgi:hypothetical protein